MDGANEAYARLLLAFQRALFIIRINLGSFSTVVLNQWATTTLANTVSMKIISCLEVTT